MVEQYYFGRKAVYTTRCGWNETVEIFIILNAELSGNTEQNADIFILDNFVFFAPCAYKNSEETKPSPLLQNLTYDDENSTSGWFRV